MAQFTQGVPQQPAPSYVGLSKEPDKPRPNETLGTLFKGLGSLLDQGVAVADQDVKTKINSELYDKIDTIRDSQGVGAAVADAAATSPNQLIPTGDAPKAPPPQIDSVATELQRLTAAKAEGKIGDTYYYSKVDALTRSVRSKYPGYREEIDKKVSSIVGTTPANALRQSLLQDLANAQGKADKSKEHFESFVKQNLEYIPPDLRDRYVKGERGPQLQAEMETAVGTAQYEKQGIQNQKNKFELQIIEGKVKADEVEAGAINEVATTTNRMFNNATAAAGGNVVERIRKLVESGKTPTPEEQAQIGAQFSIFENQVSNTIDGILDKPFKEGSSNTYRSTIKDSSKINSIKEQAMSKVAGLKKMLVDGDFGSFAAAANYIKASENAGMKTLLESSDSANQLVVAKRLLGDNLGVYLTDPKTGGAILSDVNKALKNMTFVDNLVGRGNPVAQLDMIVKQQKESGSKDPAVIKEYLKVNSTALADPKISREGTVNLANAFYDTTNTNFLTKFRPEDQPTVYAQLTSPEITKNMVKLKETNPEQWQKYQRWAGESFFAMNKKTIDNLINLNRSNSTFSFSVDPETGKLNVMDTGLPTNATPGDSLARSVHRGLYENYTRQFNMAVDSLTPIYKADGMKVYDALGREVYNQLGVGQVKGDKKPGNGEAQGTDQQSGLISLGNTIQLASYAPDERSLGRPDSGINLQDETSDLISLSAPELKDSKIVAMANAGKFSPILDTIGSAEAPGGYNTIQGRNRRAPLGDMTIREVFDLQRRMIRSGSESSAVGRYQFIGDTLRETVNAMGFDPDTTKFTPEVQDKLAVGLVGKALQAYTEGRMTRDQLADRLADRWAGLPLSSGRSKYHGVGSNRATISRQKVLEAIDKLGV